MYTKRVTKNKYGLLITDLLSFTHSFDVTDPNTELECRISACIIIQWNKS